MDNKSEDPRTFVTNADQLVSVFGKWPSFHDAEVQKVRLDRNGTCLEIVVFVFTTNRETDESGYFIRLNQSLLTIRFGEIEDMELDGFNHQNVLAAITFHKGQRIEVEIHPIFGLGGKFACASVEITNVEPYVVPSA